MYTRFTSMTLINPTGYPLYLFRSQGNSSGWLDDAKGLENCDWMTLPPSIITYQGEWSTQHSSLIGDQETAGWVQYCLGDPADPSLPPPDQRYFRLYWWSGPQFRWWDDNLISYPPGLISISDSLEVNSQSSAPYNELTRTRTFRWKLWLHHPLVTQPTPQFYGPINYGSGGVSRGGKQRMQRM
jgi:hypothetical protein